MMWQVLKEVLGVPLNLCKLILFSSSTVPPQLLFPSVTKSQWETTSPFRDFPVKKPVCCQQMRKDETKAHVKGKAHYPWLEGNGFWIFLQVLPDARNGCLDENGSGTREKWLMDFLSSPENVLFLSLTLCLSPSSLYLVSCENVIVSSFVSDGVEIPFLAIRFSSQIPIYNFPSFFLTTFRPVVMRL